MCNETNVKVRPSSLNKELITETRHNKTRKIVVYFWFFKVNHGLTLELLKILSKISLQSNGMAATSKIYLQVLKEIFSPKNRFASNTIVRAPIVRIVLLSYSQNFLNHMMVVENGMKGGRIF